MDAPNIKLFLTDVDGVLTDGSILLGSDGGEYKRFHVRDGAAIAILQKLGIRTGVLSGRTSEVTPRRAKELGMEFVVQCSAMHKAEALEDLCADADIDPAEVAYIGDDLADLPVLRRVGYPMAVADAAAEVRDVARYVTRRPGGRGAVREAIEHLLKQMGRWDDVLDAYVV